MLLVSVREEEALAGGVYTKFGDYDSKMSLKGSLDQREDRTGVFPLVQVL